jgi:hypothetical protein
MSHKDDEKHISRYQCILRQQIEYFEAGQEELQVKAQGRNAPIRKGQVRIRCQSCAMASAVQRDRSRGAAYHPAKLESLFQAVQNMANNHIKNRSARTSLKRLSTKSRRPNFRIRGAIAELTEKDTGPAQQRA